MRIAEIVRHHRGAIALSLILVAIEHAAWIAEPSAFGPVIDLFVDWRAEHKLPAAAPLLIWVALFATNSLAGAVRRSVDARIFGRMFADLAARVSARGIAQRLPPAQTSARGDLTHEFVDFLQFRVPEVIEEIIGLGGALIGVAVFDWRIAVACGVAAVPLALLTTIMARRVAVMQATVHDMKEQSYLAYSSNDPEKVRTHFLSIANVDRRIAKSGAAVFGVMRICMLAIFLVVLYVAIDLDGFTTGNIYSIVAYLWTFITSSESIPELAESWTSLRDLSGRMEAENT